MPCSCNLSGLLQNNLRGVFSASIDGSTSIEISEDTGVVLIGSTVSNLSISAYAFLPGEDPYLGATCSFSAQASIPWITKYDCFTGQTYFIPKSGGKASVTNRIASGINTNIIDLSCSPGIIGRSFNADASSGPATPYLMADREDGYNLVYTGNPISINSGVPQMYTINLGTAGIIEGFLQSFSLSVNPPDVAKVQYSFAFSGVAI